MPCLSVECVDSTKTNISQMAIFCCRLTEKLARKHPSPFKTTLLPGEPAK